LVSDLRLLGLVIFLGEDEGVSTETLSLGVGVFSEGRSPDDDRNILLAVSDTSVLASVCGISVEFLLSFDALGTLLRELVKSVDDPEECVPTVRSFVGLVFERSALEPNLEALRILVGLVLETSIILPLGLGTPRIFVGDGGDSDAVPTFSVPEFSVFLLTLVKLGTLGRLLPDSSAILVVLRTRRGLAVASEGGLGVLDAGTLFGTLDELPLLLTGLLSSEAPLASEEDPLLFTELRSLISFGTESVASTAEILLLLRLLLTELRSFTTFGTTSAGPLAASPESDSLATPLEVLETSSVFMQFSPFEPESVMLVDSDEMEAVNSFEATLADASVGMLGGRGVLAELRSLRLTEASAVAVGGRLTLLFRVELRSADISTFPSGTVAVLSLIFRVRSFGTLLAVGSATLLALPPLFRELCSFKTFVADNDSAADTFVLLPLLFREDRSFRTLFADESLVARLDELPLLLTVLRSLGTLLAARSGVTAAD